MYTWNSTFSRLPHPGNKHNWSDNTSKFPWQRLGRGRTFTGAGGTCELPVGSTEGDSRDLKYLLSLHLDVTRSISDEAGARRRGCNFTTLQRNYVAEGFKILKPEKNRTMISY